MLKYSLEPIQLQAENLSTELSRLNFSRRLSFRRKGASRPRTRGPRPATERLDAQPLTGTGLGARGVCDPAESAAGTDYWIRPAFSA